MHAICARSLFCGQSLCKETTGKGNLKKKKKIALDFLVMYLPQREISEREHPQMPFPVEKDEGDIASLVLLYTLPLCVRSLKIG